MSIKAFRYVRDSIKFDPEDTTIFDVTFDAAISETTSDSNEITLHPVEFGANISDHNYPNPRSWSIEYVVTNTPFVNVAISKGANDSLSRVVSAWQVISDIRNRALIFDLFTGLEIQSNVQIKSLDVTQDKDTSEVLRFTANLVQIIVVESVIVPYPKDQLAATITKQTQSTTEAGQKQKPDNRTITKKLSDFTGLSDFLGL